MKKKKHNYEADKKRKINEVRILRKVEKQMYDAAPSFARKINEHQIKQFSEDLKAAKRKNQPMLIDLLEGNECKPIVTQDITLREIRDNGRIMIIVVIQTENDKMIWGMQTVVLIFLANH